MNVISKRTKILFLFYSMFLFFSEKRSAVTSVTKVRMKFMSPDPEKVHLVLFNPIQMLGLKSHKRLNPHDSHQVITYATLP